MHSQTIDAPGGALIDPTDVPAVAVRELATALKALVPDLSALIAGTVGEIDLKRADEIFWQRCPRDRHRKVATLVRLRCLIEARRSRRLTRLIAEHGNRAIAALVAAAAEMRLNSAVGFSDTKLVWAVSRALALPEHETAAA
ncbi:MAG: hypothetical protein NW216_09910 [Hyphomicrobium sp.]|nr:hypothetical protein [Hyphomicrobium sp.]